MFDPSAPTDATGNYILALDAGGTMTDAILVKPDGGFKVGKSITRRTDEARSYIEAVKDAAAAVNADVDSVHRACSVALYCGTGMLNTILTGTGKRVGLMVTRGFEDITVQEGGLTYLGQTQAELLHQQLHRHPRPLMKHSDVIGISERVCGGSIYGESHLSPGEILIPLDEREVREAAARLIDSGVEIIGIMFINSYADPRHELRAAELAREVARQKGSNIPVLCSVEVAPVSRENSRLKSLLFQCLAAESIRESYLGVEQEAQSHGYRNRLLTLLSYGGAVNVRYPRLYETLISGPIGGLMGARFLGDKLGLNRIVTTDMGGTSFDVGLVVDGRLTIQRSADIAGHRLALPMVQLDSIGSGAGSEVRIDQYKRLHVGPESAGARVGKCLDFDRLTITDINVALGYVDPDYFLGGHVKLSRERALAALKETVADPLGLDVYEAGAGVLDIVNVQMRDLLATMVASKGYNPAEFTLLYYGGAGPVHMWGFTEGLTFADIITVPWAAGFSAFGAACAEYMHRYDRGITVLLPNGLPAAGRAAAAQSLRRTWHELTAEAFKEMANEGVSANQLSFRFGFSARYLGQLESFDAMLPMTDIESFTDVAPIIEAFESMYTNIYPEGARFPDAGYSVTSVYLEAIARKPQPHLASFPSQGSEPDPGAFVERRKVYHRGKWTNFQVWEMQKLTAGNVIKGPAILRDPMTTLVVPPGRRIEFDQFLVIHYR